MDIQMVEVRDKETTRREAVAEAKIAMSQETLELIKKGKIVKGDVLATARVAAILAAKGTPSIIPLCHPIEITSCKIDLELKKEESLIRVIATVRAVSRTGVEMEALTACAVSCLTIYDMCKAYERDMTIYDLRLIEKRGGESGEYKRDD